MRELPVCRTTEQTSQRKKISGYFHQADGRPTDG